MASPDQTALVPLLPKSPGLHASYGQCASSEPWFKQLAAFVKEFKVQPETIPIARGRRAAEGKRFYRVHFPAFSITLVT